jgi:hypothetical protein
MTAIMLAVVMTALGMAGTIGGARALVVSRPLKSEDARKRSCAVLQRAA